MNPVLEEWKNTLNAYIKHFGRPPPADYINRTQWTQQEIDDMKRAILDDKEIE